MTNIESLLSVGSESLTAEPVGMPGLFRPHLLGTELFQVLRKKNGFYAFESALHVFPLMDSLTGLEAWNAGPLWRNGYEDLAVGLLFFAEDIFQDQFCLSTKQNGVLRFYAETGETTVLANSIEEWAGVILSNYRRETGWPFVHEWQTENGLLLPGMRLMPKTPFFMGGAYDIKNLWAGSSLDGMRLKADLAMQTRHLAEGAPVMLNIAPKPER